MEVPILRVASRQAQDLVAVGGLFCKKEVVAWALALPYLFLGAMKWFVELWNNIAARGVNELSAVSTNQKQEEHTKRGALQAAIAGALAETKACRLS